MTVQQEILIARSEAREEALEEGRAEGRAEGREEGREEGRVEREALKAQIDTLRKELELLKSQNKN